MISTYYKISYSGFNFNRKTTTCLILEFKIHSLSIIIFQILPCLVADNIQGIKKQYFDACYQGNYQDLEIILGEMLWENISIDIKDKKGLNGLLIAAYHGHEEVVKLLLNNKANIEVKTPRNSTPLLLASQKGHLSVVKVLIRNGAKIEAGQSNSNTPLSWAAQNGHIEIANYLINNGANLEAKNFKGATPIILASQTGHLGVSHKTKMSDEKI